MAGNPKISPIYEYQPAHVTAAATGQPLGQPVNMTSATAVAGGGSATVTLNETNAAALLQSGALKVGTLLDVWGGTGTPETVFVTAINPATPSITAIFANAHSGTYNLTTRYPVALDSVIVNNPGTSATLTLYNGGPYNGLQGYGQTPNNGLAPWGAIAVVALVAGMPPLAYHCKLWAGLWYTLSATADLTFAVSNDLM